MVLIEDSKYYLTWEGSWTSAGSCPSHWSMSVCKFFFIFCISCAQSIIATTHQSRVATRQRGRCAVSGRKPLLLQFEKMQGCTADFALDAATIDTHISPKTRKISSARVYCVNTESSLHASTLPVTRISAKAKSGSFHAKWIDVTGLTHTHTHALRVFLCGRLVKSQQKPAEFLYPAFSKTVTC